MAEHPNEHAIGMTAAECVKKIKCMLRWSYAKYFLVCLTYLWTDTPPGLCFFELCIFKADWARPVLQEPFLGLCLFFLLSSSGRKTLRVTDSQIITNFKRPKNNKCVKEETRKQTGSEKLRSPFRFSHKSTFRDRHTLSAQPMQWSRTKNKSEGNGEN